jgi:uncharacterized Tic20 family protein
MSVPIFMHTLHIERTVEILKKGKFGLSTAAIAVIAFVFTALRQPTAVLLICGFALLAEKDEWLNRQVLQALLLSMAYFLADTVITWAFSIFSTFFRWINAYGAVNAIISVSSFFSSIIYIAMLVFTVLAVIRVARGKDAKLPIIEKMAGGDITAAFTSKSDATGVVSPAQAAPPAQAPPIAQPVTFTQVENPVQATAPVQTVQPTAPVQEDAPSEAAERLCSSCSAPLPADSRFCIQCGAKAE